MKVLLQKLSLLVNYQIICISACCYPDPATTNPNYGICAFNSATNVVAVGVGNATNIVWGTQDMLLPGLACYCQANCTPPQIVCTGPNNVLNVVAKLTYLAELWMLHCYCPTDPPAANPCSGFDRPFFCTPSSCSS